MLLETIAVRSESSRSSDKPAQAPGIGVTDVPAGVEQTIHALVAAEG